MKACGRCAQTKPADAFPASGGLTCKACKAAITAAWRQANPERARAAVRSWVAANPEKVKGIQAAALPRKQRADPGRDSRCPPPRERWGNTATQPIPLSVPRPVFAPPDPVFAEWCATGLVWLPEKGMGYLPVPEGDGVYDKSYFAKYQAYAKTERGVKITAARVDLVRRYTDGHLVDVGIGCGAFVWARRGWTHGYDVNPEGVRWLMSEGRWCDPYEKPVDAVSLWDVLEHLPDPGALLRNVKTWVFVSLPIVPGDGPPAQGWKHYRPLEHVWYWTRDGFTRWVQGHGFEVVHHSEMEQAFEREDIETFVLKRKG